MSAGFRACSGIGSLALLLGCDLVLRAAVTDIGGKLLSLLPALALVGIAEARMIVTSWALLHERGIEPAVVTIGLVVLYSGRQVPLWAEMLSRAVGLLLLLPIRATLMTVVYAETRARLEGYDLEVAADQLSGAGAV